MAKATNTTAAQRQRGMEVRAANARARREHAEKHGYADIAVRITRNGKLFIDGKPGGTWHLCHEDENGFRLAYSVHVACINVDGNRSSVRAYGQGELRRAIQRRVKLMADLLEDDKPIEAKGELANE